ncbi:hypothetical protein RVR_7746 [Actinacidiphila reveromycinica]|uniref:Uncharacterized protein n=1 Tax=Actinacidiphila reveromycinica TaxID=659352 RepID=A0A7U3UXM7_9ACTN|nr:hypothetical protein [Streptomyces sp. SN-593]BBB00662.1 hypothetical protein RVR_7746 [Streptomyces sp. SN-593]
MALALTGGALWWLAVLRFGLRPDPSTGPAAGLHAAIVAGGWSLGLIPMHAVPVRRPAATPSRPTPPSGAPAAADVPARGGQPWGGEDGEDGVAGP